MTTTLAHPEVLPGIAPSDTDAIVRAMEQEGSAFMPGACPPALAAEACRRIATMAPLKEHNDCTVASGNPIDHFKVVFNRDPFWLQFLDRARIVDALERLLGPDCHIIGMSAWRTPPAGPELDRSQAIDRSGALHADQIFIPIDSALIASGAVRLPMFLGTLHYYLCDIDLDLCPTWVLPGSHLAGRGPTSDPLPVGHHGTVHGPERTWGGREQIPVLCQAGDALLFRSEIWHRGSANRTRDRERYLLQVHYGQRGMAQRFPPYTEFAYNRAVLAQATPRQARLLGRHAGSAYG